MKKHTISLLLFSAVLSISALPASVTVLQKDTSTFNVSYTPIDSGINLLVRQEYREAAQIFRRLAESNTEDFRALYYLLANRQTRVLDYESYILHGDSLIAFADSVVERLNTLLPGLQGRDSLDCLFFLANSYGGIGVVHAKRNNWITAVKYGYRSISMLRELVASDSSYHSAFLGVGVFDYYLSQNMRWMPFFGDRTKEGIREIIRATGAPPPFDLAAKNSLCWIYIEQDRYREADSICQSVLKDLPNNTVFLRIAACSSLWSKQWDKAIAYSNELITFSKSQIPVNWSNLLTGYRSLSDTYFHLKKYDKCLETADLALAENVEPQYMKISYVKDHLKEIQKLKKKCVSLSERNQ